MGKRNQVELYEILNRNNVIERIRSKKTQALRVHETELVESVQQHETPVQQEQQSVLFDINQTESHTLQSTPSKVDETSVPTELENIVAPVTDYIAKNHSDEVVDMMEDFTTEPGSSSELPLPTSNDNTVPFSNPSIPVAQKPVSPFNSAPQTDTGGPPYNFNLNPPKSKELDVDVFGERKLVLSYDVVLITGIVALVLLVIIFVMGTQWGGNSTTPGSGDLNTAGVNSNGSTDPINRTSPPTTPPNTGDAVPPPTPNVSEANASSAATEPSIPEMVVGATTQNQTYWIIVLCTLTKQDAAKKQDSIDRFVAHLRANGFPTALARHTRQHVEICVAKSTEKISTISPLVKKAQGSSWRDSQTGVYFGSNDAFIKKVYSSN